MPYEPPLALGDDPRDEFLHMLASPSRHAALAFINDAAPEARPWTLEEATARLNEALLALS